MENYQADYRFQEKLVGKRIKGTASRKIAWESRLNDGSMMKHVYEGEGAMELRLRVDQTVVGTETHSGKTNGAPSIQDRKIRWIGKWSMGAK